MVAQVEEFHLGVAMLADRIALVSVAGELDLYTSGRLQEAIGEAASLGAETVVLDLSCVGFVESTAVGVIVHETKRLDGRGRSLLLIANDPRTLRVFEVTGVNHVLHAHATLHDALTAIGLMAPPGRNTRVNDGALVTMQEADEAESWPRVEELVPPELPPEVAVARLVAVAKSLLAENRRLRELLARDVDTPVTFTPAGGGSA